MSKYDTYIDLSKKSSLTYMISNIQEGASVLEFGPATGYMTRYLKEEKKCQVYIVEIDQDSFEEAIQFAEDGICCNAEDMTWVDKFQGQYFDYITFADVLEHMVDPLKVLKNSKIFLKQTGRILISIPNIGNNAVLIDLYNNKFQYRKTGIMDNTHLRFFTYNSLHEFFEKCDLDIVDEDAVVYYDLEYVGFGNQKTDVPPDFWKEISQRKFGFVNQFLFTLSLRNCEKENNDKFLRDIRCQESYLYYSKVDTPELFCEDQKLTSMLYEEDGAFSVEFDLSIIDCEVAKVCFSPFLKNCAISDVRAVSEQEKIPLIPLESFKLPKGEDGFIYSFPKYEMGMNGQIKLQPIRLSGKVRNLQQDEVSAFIIDMKGKYDREVSRLNTIITKKEETIRMILQVIQSENERG